MALKSLFGRENAGSACGSGDKKPAVCGTGDKK